MQLTYYNNKTDKRYLAKKLEKLSLAGHSNPVQISMIEDTSIAKPVFKMKDKDIYMTANYCYVDTLHRYYYIDDIVLSNGFAYLHCTVDVLMSYARQLANIEVIVERNQIRHQMYQVDNDLTVNNYTSNTRLEFSHGFDENEQQFMLCVIGDTTSSSLEQSDRELEHVERSVNDGD